MALPLKYNFRNVLVRWRSTRLGQGGATALPIVGRFLKSTYDDPAFKAWTKESFPTLTGEAAMAFGCPDRYAPPDWLLYSIS